MSNDAELDKLVQRFAAMRALASRAMAEQDDDARALFGAAMAFRIIGDHEAAFAALQRAAALEPENTHFLYELGKTQEYLGGFGQAERLYASALEATPENYRARQALAQLRKQSGNDIAALEAEFGMGDDAEGWRSLHLGHALAKSYEDLGDIEKSFAWLERAKARRRALRPYRAPLEEALAQAALSIGGKGAAGHESIEPIFVAGLPRSGTTLVDRILSSHPDVMSAGEIGNFAQLMKRMSGSTTPATLDPDTLGRVDGMDFAALGRLYIESTRPLTGSAPRFVDKAPSNYLLAGVIHRALPNARFLCLRRHPLDSVLSNYKQMFPFDDRYYDYVYALEAAAHKFIQFDRLAQHWAATLPPDRFTIVQYETLVSNQDAETRRIVAFAGLSWDDRCLAFHENAASVATPSAQQVRSAMYASAMGRWAKYGAMLDPARRVLERAGVDLG